MNRRDFTATGLLLGATPWVAQAQQPRRPWRLGRLVTTGVGDSPQFDAFKQGLQALGHVEGGTYVLESRSAQGKDDRLPELAIELVRAGVDLILAGSVQATRAAQKATTTLPIVMLSIGDPVARGLVASLARPGANVTGTSNSMVDVAPKHLDLVRDLMPKARQVAFLMDASGAAHQNILEVVLAQAPRAGLRIQPYKLGPSRDFEAVFAQMVKDKAQAVIVPTSASFIVERQGIAQLAVKHRLPCLGFNAEYADAGFLLSYGSNLLDIYRRSATYVDRILKGTKPADLPVELPTLFELVINNRTALEIGLTVPRLVLARADRVIE